jgi:hypothetical protein
MKKLTISVMIMSMLAVQPVKADTIVDYLRDYGIPCALSLGAGLLLAKDGQTGGAIGAAGCLGIGGATYLSKQREAKALELKESHLKQIQGMIDTSNTKKDSEIDSRMKAMEEAQKVQLEEMKGIMREVLAERMMKMEVDMKEQLTKKLESGELMPKLEENIKAALKTQVVSEVKSNQKAIVEKCVEQTIKEVIAKPIGVPANPSGVEEDEQPAAQ